MRHCIIYFTLFTLIFGCNSDEDSDKDSFDNLGPIEITVDGNYLNELEDGWIFTSNSDGEVDEVKEFHNGDALRFGVAGDNSSITILKYTYGFGSQDRVELSTFVDLDSMNFLLNNLQLSESTSIGTHTAVIRDINPPYQYPGVEVVQGARKSTVSYDPLNPTKAVELTAELYETPVKIIYTLRNTFDEKIKYEVDDAEIGETVQLSASQFVPFNFYVLEFEDAEAAVADVLYLKKAGDYSTLKYFGVSIANLDVYDHLEVEYPSLNAPEFMTVLRWDMRDQETEFFYTRLDDQPIIEYRQLDASISNLYTGEKEISFKVSGDLDAASIFSENFTDEMAGYWTIYDRERTQYTFRIPELPTQILSRYQKLKDHDFKFEGAQLEDATGIPGYYEWIESWYSREYFYSTVKERMQVIKRFSNESGGKGKQKRKKTNINSPVPGIHLIRNYSF
jgi:hypothetical protein